ncbi:hypothetical protein NP493_1501g01029 [Ridgeia piscesae]|uniref:Mucin-like protein n=1 Tax=Ridgeia piscesae TaxID=27915 RepID=A0AAD9NC65_RIDPI|nr:hypothetical protein NP493_1501g01029 [Ridgeia piscesae]
MVVTWVGMTPRQYYYPEFEKPNTFQLVVAYDPSRYQTFTQYVYMDLGWNDFYLVRHSMIGHFSYKYEQEESLQLAPSMTSLAFSLDTRDGNTGDRGRYMFRVASGRNEVNYDQKCFNWFANEMRRYWLLRSYWAWTRDCPCDGRLAMGDGRWRFDRDKFYKTGSRCYYERTPWGQSSQECCYTAYGSLIGTEDGRAGQSFLYHPRYERLHKIHDVLPKQWCCEFSDNCHSFYKFRPMDHCSRYRPVVLAWFYGDPHIHTMDGFQYTFNGLGEYTLVETTHGNFTLQGRTAKARDDSGKETDATVFSAFAARDANSDTVHVGMTLNRDGLNVRVQNNDVMENWFNRAQLNDEKEYTDLTLTKKYTTQIEVTFKSGFSLTIGVSAEQLDITVATPDNFKDNTKGLMGVFNDDPTDDLLPPGVNAVALSNSSSEKTIFNEFGEKWRIPGAVDSLFYYASGESYSTFAQTDFKPLFLEDVLANMSPDEKTKATKTCGDNKECLFDFAVTANRSPNITVESAIFNVTVGKSHILKVSVYDPDNDPVTLSLQSTLPPGASWQVDTFTWTPSSMDPVNISFSAADGKGGVAATDIFVNLCNCSGHGECLFDLLADGYELKQTFRIVHCNCSTGWEAINECDPDQPTHDCEQVCVNQPVNYTCACRDGYRLMDNKRNCSDIDECDEQTSGCEQTCTNTNGSFVCSCFTGFTLNTDKKTCEMSKS